MSDVQHTPLHPTHTLRVPDLDTQLTLLLSTVCRFAKYAFRASPASSVSKTVDRVLPDVATYRQPSGMQAGTYAIKPACYDECVIDAAVARLAAM